MDTKIKFEHLRINKTSFASTMVLLWVIDGDGVINISDYHTTYHQEHLFLIPSNTRYEILPTNYSKTIKIYLDSQHQLDSINHLIDINNSIIKELLYRNIYSYLKVPGFELDLYTQEVLDTAYETGVIKPILINRVQDLKVVETINYIIKHKSSRFTITDIAELIHVNPAYLSSLFSKEVGTTIVKYTNTLRLEKAIRLIYASDKTISTIAYECGFADGRTLSTLLQKRYNTTVSEIRKSNNQQSGLKKYTNFLDYISIYANSDLIKPEVVEKHINVSKEALGNYNSPFNMFAIGRAHDVLLANVQETIISAKQELDFKYLKFHNIFGDEMNIYDYDYSGTQTINLSKVIKVMDFLIELDIIPFIELGFFPKEIAYDEHSYFTGYKVNVSGKINFLMWEELMHTYFTLVKQRYPNLYKEMYFELFNEIDLKVVWKNNLDDFYKLYEITYKTAKAIDKDFKIGGFSFSFYTKDVSTSKAILQHIYNQELKVDFLSIHSYPIELINDINYEENLKMDKISTKYIEDKLSDDIDKAIELKNSFEITDLFITEWNTNINQRDFVNASTFKSSMIINQVLKNLHHDITAICFWTLSDEMVEFGYQLGDMHGGFGLVTRENIKKPAYYAFKFLTKLQGQIISSSEDHIICYYDDQYHIILNNKIGYDREYTPNLSSSYKHLMHGETNKYTLHFEQFINNSIITTYQISKGNDIMNYALSNNLHNTYLTKNTIKELQLIATPAITTIYKSDYHKLTFDLLNSETIYININLK